MVVVVAVVVVVVRATAVREERVFSFSITLSPSS